MKSKPLQKLQSKEEKIDTQITAEFFSFTITKVAVSQICRSVGFKSTQLSALETLTLIATKFLQTLAKSAASFSHSSNRTQSNLLDFINALHDLSSIEGFSGASMLHQNDSSHCLLKSSTLKDLFDFVNSTDEIPFAKPIPRNNYPENSIPPRKPGALACLDASNSRGPHIPNWLPAFPVPDASKCEESVRDGLWENSGLGPNCGEFDDVFVRKKLEGKEKRNGNLPLKRGKVRFKIEGVESGGIGVRVGMRNGVCKGGKRVSLCWNNNNNSDGIGEDDEESKSGFKRRR